MSRPREPCECEYPGAFYSGVPGILAMMEDGRLAPGAVVERCDLCERYPSDAAALAKLRELRLAESETASSQSFSVHCYALVRVKFSGVVAPDPRSAARQALDRFDWDVHGVAAEYADEVTGVLVDFDGDVDFSRSRRFSPELEEIES